MRVQTGFLLRPGALCYPECASDAEGSARAPRRARGGARGRGQLDRGLQRVPAEPIQPRRGLPHLQRDVRLGGPAHRLHHRCSLTVNSADMGLHQVVTGAYCANGACALHHLETLARPRFDTSETNRRCVNDDSPDRTRAKLGLSRSDRKLQRRDFFARARRIRRLCDFLTRHQWRDTSAHPRSLPVISQSRRRRRMPVA